MKSLLRATALALVIGGAYAAVTVPSTKTATLPGAPTNPPTPTPRPILQIN